MTRFGRAWRAFHERCSGNATSLVPRPGLPLLGLRRFPQQRRAALRSVVRGDRSTGEMWEDYLSELGLLEQHFR